MHRDWSGGAPGNCPPTGRKVEYRRFPRGLMVPGVFFILVFEVDDVDAAEAEVSGKGLEVLMRGQRENGSGFCYFDSAGDVGVTPPWFRQSPPGFLAASGIALRLGGKSRPGFTLETVFKGEPTHASPPKLSSPARLPRPRFATDGAVCLRGMVDEPGLERLRTMVDRNMHVNETYARTRPAEWYFSLHLCVAAGPGAGRLLFFISAFT